MFLKNQYTQCVLLFQFHKNNDYKIKGYTYTGYLWVVEFLMLIHFLFVLFFWIFIAF